MTLPSLPLEISVQETKRLLDATPEQVALIDVREADELAVCKIEGASHIPMQTIPHQLAQLPTDRHLLIYCHHGGRSLRVTQFLRAQGFAHATNVAGGIDAWALEIDPSLRRY
jgi:rhodanese-related sulfurtransferase